MPKPRLPVVLSLVLILLAGGFFYIKLKANRPKETNVGAAAQANKAKDLYGNQLYGFSFARPAGFSLGEVNQENGHTVLAQDQQDTKQSFQILITSWDEPGAVITKERILQDIPNMKVTEPRSLIVSAAKDPTQALEFESNNENFGGLSIEVWFVHGNNLYQISGYREAKNIIEEVIGSWEF